MKLPEEYKEKMIRLLGDESADYFKSLDEPRVYGLRANTLKITPEELDRITEFRLSPVKWCKEGFYFDGDERPSKSPLYYAGLYYIQEPSAMCAAALLPISPGDKVLDLCAAPGGKSTQAAAKLCGEGLLITNDISASRCRALVKNIELSGVSNAIVSNETPERLREKFPHFFDKIIIDAPCSGEGMFRKDREAVKSWGKHKTEMCVELQRSIIKNAAEMLAEGGIMSYSTCTFAPEENEAIIQEFLDNHTDFSLIEADKSLGFERGRPEWTANGSAELEKCGRLFPHKASGEGHFIALLKKSGERPENKPDNVPAPNKKFLKDFFDFCREYLNISIEGHFEVHGTSLFRIPMGTDLKGIRLQRSGLYLGELKKNRFEPAQAFAMTLKPENVKNTVSFPIKSRDVMRYLKGESFEVSANDGWNLVCVDKYPLGWGKVIKGRMKNKYLQSWLMQ